MATNKDTTFSSYSSEMKYILQVMFSNAVKSYSSQDVIIAMVTQFILR